MSSKDDKRRKWILSLGFSDAQADSFIENGVPNRKIEALAEVLNNGKIIDQTVTEPEPAPVTEPESNADSVATTEPVADAAPPEAPVINEI